MKRRSFLDSFERITFYVSPFTNDEVGLFEYPAGVLFMSHMYRLSKLAVSKWFSRNLLGRILEYVPVTFTVAY